MDLNRLKIMCLVITTWVVIGTITYVVHLIRKRKIVEKKRLRSKRLLKKIKHDRQSF